jgi:hypothetical protein
MFSVRSWLILALLGGCQLVFPYSVDEPPDPPPDTAVPDAPDGPDLDGDGVPDAVDNCPDVGNKDQHDEDGDLRGDRCDNCPHVATEDQANGDGDGLGDACDDSQAHDCIVGFFPLTALGTGIVQKGNWTFDGESALQTNSTILNALLVVDVASFTNPWILAKAHPLAPGADNNFQVAGVWHVVGTDFNPMDPGIPSTGMVSEIPDRALPGAPNNPQLHFAMRDNNLNTDFGLVPLEGTSVDLGDDLFFELDFRASPTKANATLDSISTTITRQETLPAGRVGLRTFNRSAAFDYVVVIERRAVCQPR